MIALCAAQAQVHFCSARYTNTSKHFKPVCCMQDINDWKKEVLKITSRCGSWIKTPNIARSLHKQQPRYSPPTIPFTLLILPFHSHFRSHRSFCAPPLLQHSSSWCHSERFRRKVLVRLRGCVDQFFANSSLNFVDFCIIFARRSGRSVA